MLVWNALAVPLLLWIDFDKGRREAGRSVAQAGIQVVDEIKGVDQVKQSVSSNSTTMSTISCIVK